MPAARRAGPAGRARPSCSRRSIDLEVEYRDAEAIDRRLAFALHRLAFESPDPASPTPGPAPFDAWTVDTVRAVQEAVERILSGQDIRYYPESEPAPTHGSGPSRRTALILARSPASGGPLGDGR